MKITLPEFQFQSVEKEKKSLLYTILSVMQSDEKFKILLPEGSSKTIELTVFENLRKNFRYLLPKEKVGGERSPLIEKPKRKRESNNQQLRLQIPRVDDYENFIKKTTFEKQSPKHTLFDDFIGVSDTKFEIIEKDTLGQVRSTTSVRNELDESTKFTKRLKAIAAEQATYDFSVGGSFLSETINT